MQEHQTIFSIKILRNKIKHFSINPIEDKQKKIKIIENWQDNIISGKVIGAKEEELKPFFLTHFFGDIFGYEYNNATNWNLRFENKTEMDGKKADGALGFFKIKEGKEINKDVRVVIEIKNARTTLDKPQNRADFKGSAVEQAFMYAAKSGEKCKWIIVSNFLEIRLYLANDMTKYESFDILSLNDENEFLRFYYLLAKGQLFLEKTASYIDILLQNRQEVEKKITKEFYEYYQYIREIFLQHLKLHNPNINAFDLLQYVQTIIDRIIFVSVIKDYDLIDYNVLKRIEKIADESWDREKTELWRQLVKFFDALDKGLPPRIHKFNGGLFRTNEKIDNLIIKDVFLKKLLRLNDYDFESDLSINILGHIFEQSITDIEKIKRELIVGGRVEYSETADEIIYKSPFLESGKRKREGIFYTTGQITLYIVSNTIGRWLEDKKEEIGINKLIDYPETKKEKEQHVKLWGAYKTILTNIRILDPACGSGAFLTQAFDFLLKEWMIVLDVISKLNEEKQDVSINGLFNVAPTKKEKYIIKLKKNIVNNNLYGVDLNYESVEISKLGLWLKSASKNDELALLDNNIKCGNSIITDKAITNKAFNWKDEFKDIIKSGGFDIIIGNPPYLSYYGRFKVDMSKQEEIYFKENYDFIENYIIDDKVIKGRFNSVMFFCEKSYKLVNSNGYVSLLVDLNIHKKPFFDIRKFLIDNSTIIEIVNDIVGFEDVFSGQTIITFQKQIQKNYNIVIKHENTETEGQLYLKSELEYNFQPPAKSRNLIIQKTYKNQTGTLVNYFPKNLIRTGITFTGMKDEFLKIRDEKNKKPLLEGKKSIFDKYCNPLISNYINYDKNLLNKLNKDYAEILDKTKNKKQLWIGLGDDLVFKQPKIIVVQTGQQITATYSEDELCLNLSLFSISNTNSKGNKSDVNLKYALAFLNSDLITYFALNENFIERRKGSVPQLRLSKLKKLPFIITEDLTISKNIITKVDLILSLKSDLTNSQDKLKNRINQNFKIRPTAKLNEIFKYDFQVFINELIKQKIQMTLKQQDEWELYYNENINIIKQTERQVLLTIEEVNDIIYELFGINNKEKEEVKE